MQTLQDYIFKLNRVYEFRVKIAGVNPKGQVMERIKNALDVFEVDTISTAKGIPIQEHRDFPKMGACEAWVFEVAVKYPATTAQLRQLIKERGAINPDCICVYTLQEDDANESAEAHGKDFKGARLAAGELEDVAGAQELVGQSRTDSMLKELTKGTPPGLEKRGAAAKTSVTTAGDTKSPVGSTQNKIPDPFKGNK